MNYVIAMNHDQSFMFDEMGEVSQIEEQAEMFETIEEAQERFKLLDLDKDYVSIIEYN